MGSGGYDFQARATRSAASGFAHTHVNDSRVFTQAAKREVNEGMDVRQIEIRECRDNPDHPLTVPVIIALDVTGSMGVIPVELIKHALPTLMSKLLAFNPDVSLMFMAVGDDRNDQAPLQVGQFEASDEKLDHWLTRTWLEGDGGGNGGESYALPWLFAINKIVTDAWEKRGQKGLIITIGDEPIHSTHLRVHLQNTFADKFGSVVLGLEGEPIPVSAIYAAASEKWNIHHIGLLNYRHPSWDFLGENYHAINGRSGVVDAIEGVFRGHLSQYVGQAPVIREAQATDNPSEETTRPPSGEDIPQPI